MSTGILEDDIERQLNLQGVFDSDIRGMDEDTIEELSNGEEFKVEVQYFEETEDDTKGRAQTRSAALQSKAAERRPRGPVGKGKNTPNKRK